MICLGNRYIEVAAALKSKALKRDPGAYHWAQIRLGRHIYGIKWTTSGISRYHYFN
jgi:hypothetical protein